MKSEAPLAVLAVLANDCSACPDRVLVKMQKVSVFSVFVSLLRPSVTMASSLVKTCLFRCVCLTLSSWVTSMLLQFLVLLVPPTAAAKGNGAQTSIKGILAS